MISKRMLWRQVLLFTLIRIVIHTGNRMTHPFLPVFARGLNTDLTAMTAAISISMIAGAAGPFIASISDRKGRRMGLILGLSIFILGTGLVTILPNYTTFLIALLFIGAGSAIFVPVTHAYFGDAVPYQTRGTIMSVIEIGWSMSFILAIPLVGIMIEHFGWQSPFPVLAGLGLIALLMIYRLVPNTPPQQIQSENLISGLKKIFNYTPAVFGLLMAVSAGAGNEIVSVMFGVWMEDTFAVEIAVLGALSMVIGVSELGGEVLAAGLIDRLGKERCILLGLTLNSLTVFLLPLLSHSLIGGMIWLFIFFITFEFWIVSSLPFMTEIFPAARATMMGVYIASWTIGRAAGALVAPYLYEYGFITNVAVCAGLNLISLFALLRIKIPSLKKVEEV
jgi:predicted MFS family arabinose efflux permease